MLRFISIPFRLQLLLLWWTFWTLVFSGVLVSIGYELGQIAWPVLTFVVLNAFGNTVIYLTSGANRTGLANIAYRSVMILALTLLEMFIWDLLSRHFFSIFHENQIVLLLLGIFSLMCGAFVGVVSWLLQQEKSRKEMNARMAESERLQQINELTSLRYQLQPHFLFNSLNSIYTLVGQSPDQAREMIKLLANFFRRSLQYQEKDQIGIEDELNAIRAYFEIEKIRFQDRLSVIFDLNHEGMTVQLPAMILQPLVENAIKHGLYGVEGRVEIWVKTDITAGYLTISIMNPYDIEHEQKTNSLGVGLKNVQRRMMLVYGRSDLLKINKTEAGQFIASLSIPG